MEAVLRTSLVSKAAEIDGWFAKAELDLLIRCVEMSAQRHHGPFPLNIVEIGSYKGRSTSALALALAAISPDGILFAVDPHQGLRTGKYDRIHQEGQTYDLFIRNLKRLKIERFVRCIRAESTDVVVDFPICLLVIDGLHLPDNVRGDFEHFEQYLCERAVVAFHDYQEHFPGVVSFVDSLLDRLPPSYRKADKVQSLIVLEKVR